VVVLLLLRDLSRIDRHERRRRRHCAARGAARSTILNLPPRAAHFSLAILVDLLWFLRVLEVISPHARQQLHHKHCTKAPQPR
jgi:hypothetical protein